MTTTLRSLRQELSKDMGGYWSGTGTTTASTLVDGTTTTPFESSDPSGKFEGSWVYLTSGTDNNVYRRIYPGGGYTPASYRVAWNNPPLVTPISSASSITFDIYSWSPIQLNRWINRGLVRLNYETRGILSLVVDGDMEASGTTDWTSSSATLTKNTTTANILFGGQALRVANSGTNGRAASTAVPVSGGESYWLSAACKVASGTASLVAYDATNSAVIKTIASGTNSAYRVFCDSFTVPTTCLSLIVRLIGAESTADVYWDHVQLLNTNARVVDVPSWIVGKNQVTGVEYLPLASAEGSTGSVFRVDQLNYQPIPFWAVDYDATASRNRLAYGRFGGEVLLFVKGTRPFTTLTSDTAATAADPAWVLAAAHVEAATELINASAAEDSKKWEQHRLFWAARLTQLTTKKMPRQHYALRVPGYGL